MAAPKASKIVAHSSACSAPVAAGTKLTVARPVNERAPNSKAGSRARERANDLWLGAGGPEQRPPLELACHGFWQLYEVEVGEGEEEEEEEEGKG